MTAQEKQKLIDTKVKSMLNEDFDYVSSLIKDTALYGEGKIIDSYFVSVLYLGDRPDKNIEITKSQYDEICSFMSELNNYL